MIHKFNCGDVVKNTITGISGIVIARGDYYGKAPNEYLVDYKTTNGAVMRGWIKENKLRESEVK